jgi:site-specific recombinase XerD
MNTNDAYKLFIEYGRSERGYARETLGKLRDCFASWILPAFSEREIETVDRLDIMRLRTAMVNKGTGTNRQYSVLMALKLFLKFCREILRLSCLDPREIKLPARPKPHVQYLTNEEVCRVRKMIPTSTFTGLRMRALFELLLGTGLRISEALSLDRQQLDRETDEIEVLGKGGKRRVVFFGEGCLSWIRTFIKRRDDDHPAVFVTTGIPRRWQRYDISKYFIDLRRKAQIDKPLTPHLLRHTFCTNLLNHGADITFIKELAGHHDIQTTARYYLGVDRQALKDVVKNCLDYSMPEEPRRAAA